MSVCECVCVRERDKGDNTALPLRPKCVYVGVCVGVCVFVCVCAHA